MLCTLTQETHTARVFGTATSEVSQIPEMANLVTLHTRPKEVQRNSRHSDGGNLARKF